MPLLEGFGLETLQRSEEWLPGLLGATNLAVLGDAIETQIMEDIDKILEEKLAKAEKAATRVVDHALNGAQRITEEQIGVIRQEATQLVDHGLEEFRKETEHLVDVLSKAIAEQRVGVKVDLGEVAVGVRKELLRVLPWVAFIIGGLNLIGVVVAVLLTK